MEFVLVGLASVSGISNALIIISHFYRQSSVPGCNHDHAKEQYFMKIVLVTSVSHKITERYSGYCSKLHETDFVTKQK